MFWKKKPAVCTAPQEQGKPRPPPLLVIEKGTGRTTFLDISDQLPR